MPCLAQTCRPRPLSKASPFEPGPLAAHTLRGLPIKAILSQARPGGGGGSHPDAHRTLAGSPEKAGAIPDFTVVFTAQSPAHRRCSRGDARVAQLVERWPMHRGLPVRFPVRAHAQVVG
ncbi:unnamed protein product [Pipistrellus nathusii]|uniref:Uncharacterized protein n=1 Tax=Pipistrellus nathusii TaxID=59473 RepID=A0ABN9ZNI1_PIPNA